MGEARRRHQQEEALQEGKRVSRRRFLALGAAAGLGLAGWKVKAMYGDSKWSFLSAPELGPLQLTASTIQQYVPIGQPRMLPPGSREMERIRSSISDERIKSKLEQAGLPVHPNYVLAAREARFGVPEVDAYRDSLVNYVDTAKDFLHQRVSGLDSTNIKTISILPGDDYSHNTQKLFVGNCSYWYHFVEITDPQNKDSKVSIPVGIAYKSGAWFSRDYDRETAEMLNWSMFVSSGTDALRAPFAEIIPFSIWGGLREYETRHGYEAYITAVETISESMSTALSHELVDVLNIPNGHALIDENHNSLKRDPRYAFVDPATDWIKSQGSSGVQDAYDLWKESPAKFMELFQG